MTLLKSSDQNSREINVALLSLEADIKNKITNFDTSAIDKQLAEINSRIDKINAGGGSSSSDEIEDINSKLNSNSIKIRNIEQNIEDIGTQINGIEQKLSDIFSAESKVTDFNATTDSGIYYWVTDAANRPTDYGVLLVNKYDNGGDGTTGLWINQVAYGTNNKIYFRQNINSSNWTEWKAVAFEGQINATLTVNGKTYNGSEAVDAGVQTVENGGTGATNAADGFNTLADGVRDSSTPRDDEKMLLKPASTWYKTTCLDFWNYIKGKISSVLGLTKDNYGGKAASAGKADTDANGNNIVNTYATKTELEKTTTKSASLSTVTTGTTKYIKLGAFYWSESISFRCKIRGDCFQDIVNINILNGNTNGASVCGYYSTNSGLIKSIIVKRGDNWSSNAEIYLKITQLTTADVFVTIDKDYQDRINISESTTAPSGRLEEIAFNSVNGMFTNNIKVNNKLVIPIGAPSSLEDGCIWIER